jgi:poly-beta-1,6-N-acetyl-D-glucosamine synthase
MSEERCFKYVVITPAKDEGRYIGETLISMTCQTVKPLKWVVVDDCSKDDTASIVRQFMEVNEWIELLSLNRETQRYPGSPVVNAFIQGLESLKVDYDFVVKLDGDLKLPYDYFEKLIERFKADNSLGIASGVYLETVNDRWEMVRMPAYHAAGASKVIRKECFLEIGGFLPTLGWDTIDEIKARAKGWKTTHFSDLPFYHLKKEGTGIGSMRTNMVHGRIFYLTGGSPLFFLFKAIKRIITGRPPVIGGVVMIWGYLKAVLSREPRLVTRDEAALYNKLLSERMTSKATARSS